MRKRPNVMLSQARAYWRLARKAWIRGQYRQAELYGQQADRIYKRYLKTKPVKKGK